MNGVLRMACLAFAVAVGAQGASAAETAASGTGAGEWHHYAGDAQSTKYSPLSIINKDNVKNLKISWRWKSENFGPRPEFNMEETPLMVDGVLYFMAGTRRVAVAVDAATGAILWKHSLQKIKHENGAGGTPVLFGNRLIFDCDGSDQQYIVALDTATGEVAWKTERSGERNPEPQLKKAYGSPIVTEIDGRTVVLSTGADWLYAYDPTDGRELWKQAYGVLGFSIVPRPIVGHGMAFISTSFMQPELLAVKLPTGDALPEIAWRVKKSVPNIPSPILVGDEIVMVSDKGVATCLDADSGEVRFSERLGGNFCSSPIYADGRIWVGNREGQTFILTPGKEFHVEATNQLDGEIMATPIAVGPALFLRTDKAVYRIEKR